MGDPSTQISEKEKMLAGMLYNATKETDLTAERQDCKELTWQFNSLNPKKMDEKRALLKKIFGKIGENFWVEAPLQCDYGYNIEIGDNFYSNVNFVVLDCAKVTIGDNVFVAPNVSIHTAGHPLDVERRNGGLEFAHPVKICNNCWIGAGVNILPGVTIGEGCVIGAGSVVTKDIPANSLAVGVPAKVVKKLNDEAEREEAKKSA
ncbi:hypothetical protein AAVH_08434 [Aphelenchoides avenae]|nr:hypothetical protein AAVH_08434 [Aphelenchus avenae]